MRDDNNPFDGLEFDMSQGYPEIPEDIFEMTNLASMLFAETRKIDEFLEAAIRGEMDSDRATFAENCFCLGFLTFYENMKAQGFLGGGGDDNVH